jgi:hypothetical protein
VVVEDGRLLTADTATIARDAAHAARRLFELRGRAFVPVRPHPREAMIPQRPEKGPERPDK